MLVEYITPQKLPKSHKGPGRKSNPALQINFKNTQFYFSAELINLLNSACPDFKSIVILNTTEFDADKNPIIKHYIQPRLDGGGFALTPKPGSKTRHFRNLGLSAHLRDAWAIDYNATSVKIPVFTEPVDVRGAKSFEINLKHIQNLTTHAK